MMGRHFTQYSTHQCYTLLLLPQRTRTSVHTFRFQPTCRFRLSPDKVVEHRSAYTYSHNQVVWPAGRLPGSSRSYRSPVGSWVNSGAVTIVKTCKTHIYSCAQKWLYATAKLRTVKHLVARMIITDNVRMSRSWFTFKDMVYTECVITPGGFLNLVPAKRRFHTDHHKVQWCLNLVQMERWSVQHRIAAPELFI